MQPIFPAFKIFDGENPTMRSPRLTSDGVQEVPRLGGVGDGPEI
jgi:hypothetical protein